MMYSILFIHLYFFYIYLCYFYLYLFCLFHDVFYFIGQVRSFNSPTFKTRLNNLYLMKGFNITLKNVLSESF